MIDILNLPLEELTDWLQRDLGQQPFRARQIWKWLWHRRARSFAEMSDLPVSLRALLEKQANITWPAVETTQTSSDGTSLIEIVGNVIGMFSSKR